MACQGTNWSRMKLLSGHSRQSVSRRNWRQPFSAFQLRNDKLCSSAARVSKIMSLRVNWASPLRRRRVSISEPSPCSNSGCIPLKDSHMLDRDQYLFEAAQRYEALLEGDRIVSIP